MATTGFKHQGLIVEQGTGTWFWMFSILSPRVRLVFGFLPR